MSVFAPVSIREKADVHLANRCRAWQTSVSSESPYLARAGRKCRDVSHEDEDHEEDV